MIPPRSGLLAASLLASAFFAAHAPAQTIRILPMGDSITDGSAFDSPDGTGGYRGPLYDLLTNAGYVIDYVGTNTVNSQLLVEKEHEGHGGWRIGQLDDNVEGWFNAIADPDFILLHIGTNDFGGGASDPDAINRLDALITKMAGLRPNAHIIVTNIMERNEPANTNIQNEFNAFVEARVNAQIAAGNLVSFLDMRSAVPLSDMPDNLHPDQNGYNKMAAAWFGAIQSVLEPGDEVPPSIVRADGSAAGNEVIVTFNRRLDPATAENVANYAIDGGVNVLSASLGGGDRVVTLTTSAQVLGVTYTLTVNNVQDLVTPVPNTIAPNSTAQFLAPTPRGFFNNVEEAECYTLVYSLDIPNAPTYGAAAVPYTIDYRDQLGSFDRVAYYMELQTPGGDLQYAWASMDAFSTDLDEIGVPVVAAGVTFQQSVSNLNVVSNVAGVTVGEGQTGNIEFWPSNYSPPNTGGVPGASDAVYDFGDGGFSGGSGYGSMQIHNTTGAQTVIAFNSWNSGASADVGIGNNPSPTNNGVDWTFAQNAAGFEIKTLQVLVRTVGDVTSPTLASAVANFSRTGVTVRFSEAIRRESLVATNFALDNGVVVLNAVVGSDLHEVFLETTLQPEATALTLTVDNARDTSVNANQIAAASTIAVTATDPGVLPPEVVTNIGAAADGYNLAYTLEIPAVGNFNAGNPYLVDNSGVIGPFTRVAYYLELELAGGGVEYVWTAMDAFTANLGQIGVPTVGSGAFFQQVVNNLDVISNKGGVVEGTGIATGNIEFWPSNYNGGNGLPIPNASATAFDFGDGGAGTGAGYGSMQVHNHGASQTLFAMNNWGNDGGAICLGIGNRPTGEPDWTFAVNAGADYTRRILHVMVLPTPPPPPPEVPAEVLANVPEASDYELVYTLDIPTNGNLSGGNGFPGYFLDDSAKPGPFSRVAYYLELQATGDPEPTFVWASMDAFTDERSKIGVPNLASGAIWQQFVTGLNVVTNSGAVTPVSGGDGNLEFWPTNYNGNNGVPVPNATSSFDFGDTRDGGGAYGSMQVHNYVAGETLFAINNWGSTGNTANALCLGIGNQPTGQPDWTFADNAPLFDVLRRLHVLVKPAPPSGPEVVGAAGSVTQERILVSFDRDVSDSSAVAGNFSVDGGLTVTGATLQAGNRDILVTTSAQTPGQLYTVSVSGVRDRASGVEISAGATAQFTAYDPPAVLANVPDAGMELVYCLEIPSANPAWNLNPIPYSVDESVFGEILFDRVAYLMELDGTWAYASFDPHTNQLTQVGVPTLDVSATAFQQIVANMNVASNVPGIVTGNGIATGNIEFWGGNYQTGNGIGIPGADGATYDFGDTMTGGAYGSMQVHNHGAAQTILAYNDWGTNTGGISEVGIGNQSTGHPDWTFSNNASSFTTRYLYVLVRPGGTAGGPGPEILTHPCDRVVATGSDVTFAVSVLGDGPFTYQWRCNGIPISGATSSWLTLTSVTVVDANRYDVVVTGPNLASTVSLGADLLLLGTPRSFLVSWRIANGFHPSDGSAVGQGDNEDNEGDLRENLLEAAFGTDPNVPDAGFLSIDEGAGTFVAGDPRVYLEWVPFRLTIQYVRLVDYVGAGMSYSPEYSAGGGFNVDPANPDATRVQIPDGAGGTKDLPVRNINGFDYEVVEEPFYLFDANGIKADAQIGRVRVDRD